MCSRGAVLRREKKEDIVKERRSKKLHQTWFARRRSNNNMMPDGERREQREPRCSENSRSSYLEGTTKEAEGDVWRRAGGVVAVEDEGG